MRTVALLSLTVILAGLPAMADGPAHVALRPGQRITLHVGQIADLTLRSGHSYVVQLAGDSVIPLEYPAGKAAVRSYRAVHPGSATLLIAPDDRKQGECVDCVTRHCFLAVVP